MNLSFSVSMCVYGGDNAEWFSQAVNSVLNQTVQPDEIVLVVDGPVPEDLDRMICEYESNPIFHVIRFKENKGHGEARRAGLSQCKNELVAIMDADKEGFLRSSRSLIQTIGRAARNANGRVILFADKITDSMKDAIDKTLFRRQIQDDYNKKHNIIPKTIIKPIENNLLQLLNSYRSVEDIVFEELTNLDLDINDVPKLIKRIEKEMHSAAKQLDFERAASLRDQLKKLRELNKFNK